MQGINALSGFFNGIERDARISITHIGIYAALIQYWQTHDCANPLHAYSYEVMPVAKISASKTYHKCVRDLHDFGYILYEPSFKRNQRSKIFLIYAEEN